MYFVDYLKKLKAEKLIFNNQARLEKISFYILKMLKVLPWLPLG
jgi:hypothetical protein